MSNVQPMRIEFAVNMPSDLSAGLRGFSDSVAVTIESGNPGGEPGEFTRYMQECLAEWFDGAKVQPLEPQNQG